MSENAPSASSKKMATVNQQGSRSDLIGVDPSETTRRTPFSANCIKAYFQGALHDGTYSQNHRFRIAQKGTGWLKMLRKLLKQIGYNAWIYREGKNRSVFILETLAEFLDLRFDPLRLKTQAEQKSYIRGFFDAEGGIPHSSSARFYIQLVQKDKTKMRKLKKMLIGLGICTGKVHNPSRRVDPNYWRLFVLAKSQKDFVRIIGTWHPRKIKILARRVMI
ncbi:MAG: LAGLIDADG family homing endonuclease [bacterium]|nr:LAGLIDADG family homing endonuclease [bacterium]